MEQDNATVKTLIEMSIDANLARRAYNALKTE
jgi:hypothetical protein